MPRMGDLAATDVYSAFDVPLDQGTNVGWANRMGEILTARPQYDESTVYKTASPLVNISEGDIGRATEAAMGVSGGGLSTKGIKAYHSSPHDFDKFDLAKIGTGEGAQVYGHGLYFAENPAVSGQGGQYWNQFKNKFSGPEGTAAMYLQSAKFDREKAAQLMRDSLARDEARASTLTAGDLSDYRALIGDRMESIQMLESGQPVGPRTYEVNINADPAHMLDWDKPLKVQPEAEKQLKKFYQGAFGLDQNDFHNALRTKAFAEQTAAEGIPGIKYLDQGSRMPGPSALTTQQLQDRLNIMRADLASGRGSQSFLERQISSIENELERFHQKPTSNYVIFDPGIIDIMKKYGIAGAAPVGMGALAAQDRYQQ